jgi:hypothetical protein
MLRNNVNSIKILAQKEGIVFLTYGGFLSQTLITGMTEVLEKEAEASDLSMGFSTNIFTIFIEIAQNMMNYSRAIDENVTGSKTEGIIIVGKDSDDLFYIDSQNIVSQKDKYIIEKKLIEIAALDRDGIKKRYRELRRSGKDTHGKGAGIGFYEIAKRCSSQSYEFVPLDNGMYNFYFEATINSTK